MANPAPPKIRRVITGHDDQGRVRNAAVVGIRSGRAFYCCMSFSARR